MMLDASLPRASISADEEPTCRCGGHCTLVRDRARNLRRRLGMGSPHGAKLLDVTAQLRRNHGASLGLRPASGRARGRAGTSYVESGVRSNLLFLATFLGQDGHGASALLLCINCFLHRFMES